MICPFCNTENRDDQDVCYHCNKDLSMLRLIINKAKHHYNLALEHAERGRYYEAITELNNSIELDSKNVSAYVVLGTIYAKQNQYDKAIECWEKALYVDNRFQKAHDYIIKAGQIRNSIPLIKTFKILAVSLVCSIVVIFALIIIFNKPDRRLHQIRQAYKNFQSQDILSARQALQKIDKTKKDDAFDISKNLIDKAIKDEIKLAKAETQLEIKNERPYEAIKILNRLKSKNPDKETLSWLNSTENIIVASLVSQIKRTLDTFETEGGELEDISQSLETFKSSFPQNNEGSTLYQRFLTIMKNNCRKELAAVYQGYEDKGDMKEAEAGITNLLQKYQKYKDISKMTDETLAKIYSAEIAKAVKSCQTAIDKGNLDEAEAIISKTKEIKNIPKEQINKFMELSALITSKRAEQLVSAITKESANKNYEKVLELAKKAESYTLIEQDKKIIAAEIEKSAKNLAIQRYKWLDSIDAKFEECRQSVEESNKTIEYYPYLMANLSKKAYGYAYDDIMFYTIISYYRIGDYENGDKLAEKLANDYPKSPLLKKISNLKSKAEKLNKKK